MAYTAQGLQQLVEKNKWVGDAFRVLLYTRFFKGIDNEAAENGQWGQIH